MKHSVLMYNFLDSINKHNKLTLLYKTIFSYDVLNDYNYISRYFLDNNNLIIDIYDNILVNRFNRYIFNFDNEIVDTHKNLDDYVNVTVININSSLDISNNMGKFGYLFSDNCKDIITNAKTFLPMDIVYILNDIIKK